MADGQDERDFKLARRLKRQRYHVGNGGGHDGLYRPVARPVDVFENLLDVVSLLDLDALHGLMEEQCLVEFGQGREFLFVIEREFGIGDGGGGVETDIQVFIGAIHLFNFPVRHKEIQMAF